MKYNLTTSLWFLPMLAAVIAKPFRAGSCGDGEVLGVAQLNAVDGFSDGVSFELDAGACPGGAPIGGMKEGSVGAARPNIAGEGGNRLEFDAAGNMNLFERFPSVHGALYFAVR